MMTRIVKCAIVLILMGILLILVFLEGTNVLRIGINFVVGINDLLKKVHGFSIQSVLNNIVQMGYDYLKLIL